MIMNGAYRNRNGVVSGQAAFNQQSRKSAIFGQSAPMAAIDPLASRSLWQELGGFRQAALG